MDRSDGWSKSRVYGSSVSRREAIRVVSSVTPIESSPADIRGASAEIALPNTSEARPASCWTKSTRESGCGATTLRVVLTWTRAVSLDPDIRWVDVFVADLKRNTGNPEIEEDGARLAPGRRAKARGAR